MTRTLLAAILVGVALATLPLSVAGGNHENDKGSPPCLPKPLLTDLVPLHGHDKKKDDGQDDGKDGKCRPCDDQEHGSIHAKWRKHCHPKPCDDKRDLVLIAHHKHDKKECGPKPCDDQEQHAVASDDRKDCHPCDDQEHGDLSAKHQENSCPPPPCSDDCTPPPCTQDCPPPPCSENCVPTPPTEIPFFPSATSLAMGLLGAAGSVGAVLLRRRG